MLTAAVFELTQQNVLTADPTNVIFSVQTGEVRVRGIELEARGNVTRELEIIGAYSKLDPKVTKSNRWFCRQLFAQHRSRTGRVVGQVHLV